MHKNLATKNLATKPCDSFLAILCIGMLIMLTGCDASQFGKKSGAPSKKAPPSADDGPVNVVAEEGVGRKGKSYGGAPITEAASQYWKTKEKLAFLNLKHAEDLYKALNGKLPKTHEAYMKEIIEANAKAIELPELNEGLEYRYDPETQTLMVQSIVQETDGQDADKQPSAGDSD